MDSPSPSNLSSLPEENSEESRQQEEPQQLQNQNAFSPSAFSSIPHRPPSQPSSQKYSPLDWLGFFDQEDDISIPNSTDVFHIYTAGREGPVVFCLHGGGYCGLSFALSACKIKEKARVVAMDLRGHGKSSTENEVDLSIETLSTDVLAVLKTLYGDSPPAIVLVGHSMGGSVAVHVATKKALPSLAGLVVVDVVEGTAMASLIHMQKILSNRMQFFPRVEKAIEWSIKGGTLRNIDSARVSIPGTLKYDDSKKCYTHRARLEETEQYWRGWYEGLSEKFLSCPVPKLLLLAGTDRLDRDVNNGRYVMGSKASVTDTSRYIGTKENHSRIADTVRYGTESPIFPFRSDTNSNLSENQEKQILNPMNFNPISTIIELLESYRAFWH